MKEGWEVKKLGEICEILDSQRKPVTKKDRKEGLYPYYGASGIQDYVDSYIFDGRYLLVGEDGAKWGTNDKSAFIIEGKCWVNNHAHILKVYDNLKDSFIEYYLVFKDLNEYIIGAIVPKLTQQALKNIPIPVPPLSEQEKIVAELDCLSGIIEKKKQQLKELDSLAQSIFYEMFGDPVENEKGWEVKKLGEVCEIIGGSTPKTNIKEYWNGDNYWVTPAELHKERYIHSTERCITDDAVNKTHLTLIPIGSVLLSSRAPIGKLCITRVPMYCNQGFKNIVCSNKLHSEYIYQYLLDKTDYLNSLGTGATFKEISKRVVEQIPIPLPPISLQQQFANKIELIEKQKELIKQSIKETETLFDSRMDYYFNS